MFEPNRYRSPPVQHGANHLPGVKVLSYSAERSRALERKLALIGKTIDTLLDLVQNQRSLRLEWYVIGLIGLEILLSFGDLLLRFRT
jgi:uncharacterized Rmd1/YagE family protein